MNDGSSPEFAPIFTAAAQVPGVHVVRHAVNLGKGAALKTGFNYALCQFPDLAGIVTADADGQHLSEDILNVANHLLAHPASLVLGVRAFEGNVPLRSRLGNNVTRSVVRLLLGQQVTDTQTGLRGIPAALLPALLRLNSTGYDFELDMLVTARQLHFPLSEVPIQTVYEPGNPTSHFNPLLDSMKIYFVLLRFCSVSLVTAALDNLVFYLAWKKTGNLLGSQIAGRAVAVLFNYFAVRRAVFFARDSHQSAFWRYLLLVVSSGAVSYSCIRGVTAAFPIPVIWAKVAVESLIFFANFAIQRDFIFSRRGSVPTEPGSQQAPRHLWNDRVIVVTMLLTGALLVYGLASSHLFAQHIWDDIGLVRARRFLSLFAAVFLPVLVLAGKYFRPYVLFLLLGATIFAIGPWAPLAVLFFLFSTALIGKWILGRAEPLTGESALLSVLLGAAVFISVEEGLVRLPWNYPWLYGGLFLLPALITPRLAWRTVQSAARFFLRPAPFTSLTERLAAGVLTLVLTAHWLTVLKPDISADAMAMHLAIADRVAWKHQFAFDVAHNIWAVMPKGGDWCYTLVYLLGGEFADRLLNFAFFLILTSLLYLACRRFLARGPALWIATLFAATPLVQFVTASLFIENILAATLFGAVTALWRFEETARRRYVFAAALLFGTALHIKLGSFAVLLPGLILLGIQLRRKWNALGPRPALVTALAALLLLVAGTPPYLIATVQTGDPVFPFLNPVFHSPALAPGLNIVEHRYREPLRLTTPYDLTFHTSRFYEGQDGGLGIQYLLLVPVGLLLLRRKIYVAWSATAIAFAAALIILLSEPNVRYLYPALPFFHVTIAWVLAGFAESALLAQTVLVASFAAALGLDLCLLPASNWYHKGFYSSPMFKEYGRWLYLEDSESRRLLIDDLNRNHPGEPVFLPSDSMIAGLHSPVLRDHWHDQATLQQLYFAQTLDDMLEFMRRSGIQRFLLPVRTETIPSPVLRTFATTCVARDLRIGPYYSGHLNDACSQRVAMLTKRRELVARGGRLVDDLDPAVEFTGRWVRGSKFPLGIDETVSFSNAPGAAIRFTFEGVGVRYAYTAAPNRGIARISIDGHPQGEINLFRPEPHWQSTADFPNLPSGKHVLQIEVTGRKDPASTDAFVDLDAFVVSPSLNH